MKKTGLTGAEIHALIEKAKAQRLTRASKNITREQGLYIQYRLKCVGASGTDIAFEVGCTGVTVSQVLSGKKHSRRIESAVAARLGYPTWNALVQELREGAV